MLRVAGLVLVLLQFAAPIHAAPLETLIEEYGRNFRGRGGSVERLYDLSRVIGDSILLSEHTPEELAALGTRLPGMIVFHEGTVLVAPDVPTFLSLARRRGDSVDVDFFETHFAVEDSSFWPKYLLRQTDYSGCTRFGSGALVATYTAWVDFAKRHPTRYRRWSKVEQMQVVDELVGGTCACGDRRSAIRELEMFLTRYPSGPASTKVLERLQGLRKGTSPLREHCISG